MPTADEVDAASHQRVRPIFPVAVHSHLSPHYLTPLRASCSWVSLWPGECLIALSKHYSCRLLSMDKPSASSSRKAVP